MRNRKFLGLCVITVAACGLLFVPGCKKEQVQKAVEELPAQVIVETVNTVNVPFTFEYMAETKAIDTINIVPQVTGIITEAPFQEGRAVKEGDVLFKIDPRPFQAELSAQKANLAQTSATLNLNNADVARYRILVSQNALQQQELDKAIAERDNAAARILANQAAIERAQLNLNYTTIQSPINGIVGEKQLSVGNLAIANTSILTTIVSIAPIYVTYRIPEADYLFYMVHKDKITSMAHSLIINETVMPEPCTLDMIDNQVDKRTGTIAVRVIYPNSNKLLRSNEFARVRVTIELPNESIVIPQSAIIEIQGTRSVYVVNDKNVVSQRTVEMGQRIEDKKWIVLSGLKNNERIITEGQLKTAPGKTIVPLTAEQATANIDKVIEQGKKDIMQYRKEEGLDTSNPQSSAPQAQEKE